MNPPGLMRYPSPHGPAETLDRLRAAVETHGMTVFAHVDHAAGASQVGLVLRPTDLLIFGSARAGTRLMQAAPTVAIDLPLRALVWQDESGVTWLGLNDPAWAVARHAEPAGLGPILAAMTETLRSVAAEVTGGAVQAR